MATEKALTLHEVAKITGYSYGTIFARKKELEAFRVTDKEGAHWRVWPSSLENLNKTRNNVICMKLQVDNDKESTSCQSTKEKDLTYGGLVSQRQAAAELGKLLAQRTKNKPRNTTTP